MDLILGDDNIPIAGDHVGVPVCYRSVLCLFIVLTYIFYKIIHCLYVQ